MDEFEQRPGNDFPQERMPYDNPGWFERLLAFLERRYTHKEMLRQKLREEQREDQIEAREDAIAARCRAGKHDTHNWKFMVDRKIYSPNRSGPNDLPIEIKRVWQGHCIHCGAPEVLIRDT